MEIELNELELAPPAVIRQAAQDFAAALAGTAQFEAFETAAVALRQDEEAQHAIQAYQAKQQSLQMMLMLNAVSAEDRAELNRLHRAFVTRPSVQDYVQAQANLQALCQALGDRLSRHIGFDFAASCGSGCC